MRRLVAVLVFALPSFAATFTVTNSGNAGPGTLRQAILDANANPGLDEIRFNTDAHLTASLPFITDPVLIDGDRAGVRSLVVLDTPFDGSEAFRFITGSSGSTLRRVDVRSFISSVNIQFSVSGVTIAANMLQFFVSVFGNNNLIGGTAAGEGNSIVTITVFGNGNELYRNTITSVIVSSPTTGTRVGSSGNGNQIRTLSFNEASVVVEGNFFTSPFVLDCGISANSSPFHSTGSLITGNTITGYDAGVCVRNNISGVQIVGNNIFGNALRAIDLDPAGATPNDPAPDADTGANNRQNFPVLTSATLQPSALQVNGTLASVPLTTFLIELFSNPAADPEMRTILASFDVTTDATGNAAFTRTITSLLPAPDEVITSSATNRTTGDTSEVSAPLGVEAPGQLGFAPASVNVNETDGTVTLTVERTGGSEGTVTVQFTTMDGSATAPADYSTTSGMLTFGPGVTSQPIVIPIVNDLIPESFETFTVTLSNATGGATIGTGTATVTINAQAAADGPTLSPWALLALIAGLAFVAIRR